MKQDSFHPVVYVAIQNRDSERESKHLTLRELSLDDAHKLLVEAEERALFERLKKVHA